ncbi:MAG TPA: pyridoxamine 5'-phosphate oxidase family protein [Candidatus Saccharimonadales bacterium]|nr:pyridoxamine 5'-phosphate oxidase family protein [Candidatus Saccharimonadales bacterium]
MSPAEIEPIIREYIEQVVHMSLATVKDNKPWVCEVHFSYDDELNLYFTSSKNSRHAQELIANPFVAGNIVTQHFKNQKVRCVEFEGEAEMLDGAEAEQTAYAAYVNRFGESEGLLNEIRKDGDVRSFKITVHDFFLFDSYGESRGKHHLPWKGKIAESSK